MKRKIVAAGALPALFLLCSCGGAEETPLASDTPREATQKVDLQGVVNHAVRMYGGAAGIAYSDGSASFGVGDMEPRPAWGTMRIPRAVAAEQRGMAVTREAVWSTEEDDSYGDVASLDVEGVLAQGSAGVSLSPDLPHTEWTPTGQAIFAARLPCLRQAGRVVELMGAIDSSHAHGLGALPDARLAEGVGFDETGAYRMRQFGLVAGPRGDAALALTAAPGSGSESDARAMTNTLAEGVREQLGSFPTAACK